MPKSDVLLRRLLGIGTLCLLLALVGFGIAAWGYLDAGRALGVVGIVGGVVCIVLFGLVKLRNRTS